MLIVTHVMPDTACFWPVLPKIQRKILNDICTHDITIQAVWGEKSYEDKTMERSWVLMRCEMIEDENIKRQAQLKTY